MPLYELQSNKVLGESAWPVAGLRARISMDVDFGDADVPPAAQRRFALQALLELVAEADAEDIQILGPAPKTDPPHPPGSWAKPEDLDLRVIKSAHRIIAEVAKRGSSGRQVLASELVGAIGLSAPTIGRLLREGEEANAYLERYVTVTPSGRTKALDLTPEGRVLASKIRAGAVPA
ncbi:MAG: hypothetical protein ACPHID_00820 [Thermoplasmatota archaeon]